MYTEINHKQNRRRGWAGLRRFERDEEGAAYTLSFVMVIPIYALLICLIIEAALILTAKLGTVYAAYAAARTASVWSSHTTWEKTMEKAKRAALKTMVPFASGTQGPGRRTSPRTRTPWPTALSIWAPTTCTPRNRSPTSTSPPSTATPAATSKSRSKARPRNRTRRSPPKSRITFPFNIPGIARILGDKGRRTVISSDISSTATIPNEGPRDNRKTIGIGYGTLE